MNLRHLSSHVLVVLKRNPLCTAVAAGVKKKRKLLAKKVKESNELNC